MSWYFLAAIGAVVLLIIVAVVAAVAAAVRPPQPDPAPSRLLAQLVRAGAVIGAIVTGGLGVVALGTIAFGGPVTATLPVRGFLPRISSAVEDVSGPTATIIGGNGFSEGEYILQGLDLPARLWLAAGTLVQAVVTITILLLIARLARQAGSEEPFARSTATLLGRSGVLLAVGGIVWQLCLAVGSSLAADQALLVTGFSTDDPALVDRNDELGLQSSGLPSPGGDITIDLWPIGIGLVLVVLAALMRQAERLQRDTAGLV